MRALIVLATVAGIIVGGNLRAVAHDPAPAAPMAPMGSMASPAPMHAGHMAHMAVTDLRPERPGDRQRADAIVAGAKRAMARYPDVAAAEQAGFKKFLPGIPLPIEHYTSAAFAREQWAGQLDPEHPTSLIFERHGSDLALVGVMYTAAASVTPDRLDALVPMSIARWHRHVDYCFAPAGRPPRPALRPGRNDRIAARVRGRPRPLGAADLRLDGPRLARRARPGPNLGGRPRRRDRQAVDVSHDDVAARRDDPKRTA